MDPVARAVNSQLHLKKHRRFLRHEKFKASGGELKDKYLKQYMKLRSLVLDENVSFPFPAVFHHLSLSKPGRHNKKEALKDSVMFKKKSLLL